MGKGGNKVSGSGGGQVSSAGTSKPRLSWNEVKQHAEKSDKWIVIDGEVYDISRWSQRHPGGNRVISHFAGQDASEAFRAFHNDQKAVRKYLKPIHVGTLPPSEAKQDEIKKDMDELRETVTKMGLFKPSVTFFTLCILQLIVLELLSMWVLYKYGNGWLPWTASLAIIVIQQVQGGWIHHDYGHLSVFRSSFWNRVFHQLTCNVAKGASARWWNHLHYQHHAKPNVLNKDPDVRLDALFVVGETMVKRKVESRQFNMPYDWQQHYFFVTFPPLLFPVYFQVMIFVNCIQQKAWIDIATMMLFYGRFFYIYTSLLGGIGACIGFYFLMRVLEGSWFVWVAQSNHIPMNIDDDKERPWLALQLNATCDIEKSAFNDWFTGHLNFQIEHHLFPLMPRHNLYKAAPLVKSLCEKHNIPYVTKPLFEAFRDIIRTLDNSGQVWSAYYHAYDME